MVDARLWFYTQSFNSGARVGCQEGEPQELVRLVRRQFVQDCKRCKEIKFIGGFGPHHDPSRGCKSGGREHCSCPVCFG